YLLRLQGGQQVVHVPGQLHDPGHAVRRALAGRGRVRASQEPLDLEGGAQLKAVGPGPLDHGPGEGALAAGVRLALLGAAVRGRPRPAGLRGQRGEPVEVRVQPQVTRRPAGQPTGRDRVVHAEHVEHRRRADPPGDRVAEPLHRYRLDARDAGVVHKGHGDRPDPAAGEVLDELTDPFGALHAGIVPHAECLMPDAVQSRSGWTTRIRPRAVRTTPRARSRRSTRAVDSRDADARLARSCWISGMSTGESSSAPSARNRHTSSRSTRRIRSPTSYELNSTRRRSPSVIRATVARSRANADSGRARMTPIRLAAVTITTVDRWTATRLADRGPLSTAAKSPTMSPARRTARTTTLPFSARATTFSAPSSIRTT